MVVVRLIANFSAARSFLGSTETKPALAHCLDAGRAGRGRIPVGDRIAVRRPTRAPLDRTRLPLTLAGGLRVTFADVVSSPLPRRVPELVRRLSADHDECSAGEAAWVKRSRDVEPH
jgi:hypothetical protein